MLDDGVVEGRSEEYFVLDRYLTNEGNSVLSGSWNTLLYRLHTETTSREQELEVAKIRMMSWSQGVIRLDRI